MTIAARCASHSVMRTGLVVLAALAAFAALVPTAGADTTLPVWTCRASAAYAELAPLLGTQRAEPVLANGFPDRATPDREQCADAATGVQDIAIPSGATSPLVTLNAASASTTIDPEIGAARTQSVTADSAIAGTVRITVPGLDVEATAITSEANGTCVAGAPVFTASSQVATLRVNTTTLVIPNSSQPQDLFIPGLIRVRLNQQEAAGDATTATQALTQRAVHVELLPSLVAGVQPLSRVVLGETKVDRNGAVCAPAPPPPTCPAGSVAQNPNATPLVCVLTVTAPCPAGSTADPNAGGACVINVPGACGTGTVANPAGTCVATAVNCPAATVRDPATNNCVLLVQRPCPAGATANPSTGVCVVQTNTASSDGENGRVGSSTGPRATCGRLDMFFVRHGFRSVGRSFTSRFGTRTVTRGRLVTCGANPRPIVGARLDVIHVLPNGQRRRKTGLRTRANGRATLILPNDLRTRKIEYAYRPDLRTSRVTSRVILNLTVRNRAGRVLR